MLSVAALSPTMSDWIAPTMSAIQASKKSGGMLGALEASSKGSSVSFLDAANSFALIAQNGVSSSTSFYAQLAAQAQGRRDEKLLAKVFKELEQSHQMVKPKNVLTPVVYFADGSTLDTNSNILTMVSGKQYDTTTGAEYVDPAFIVQMANGSYLNTKTNVLTMTDGTRIDTVTGLKVEDLIAST
jgi:hypothetical protein